MVSQRQSRFDSPKTPCNCCHGELLTTLPFILRSPGWMINCTVTLLNIHYWHLFDEDIVFLPISYTPDSSTQLASWVKRRMWDLPQIKSLLCLNYKIKDLHWWATWNLTWESVFFRLEETSTSHVLWLSSAESAPEKLNR